MTIWRHVANQHDALSEPVFLVTTPVSPAGWGDSVLDAAAIPHYFLNLAGLPGGPLSRGTSDMHLFRDLGAYWVLDDPDAGLQPIELSRNYDGLFFVEEIHVGE